MINKEFLETMAHEYKIAICMMNYYHNINDTSNFEYFRGKKETLLDVFANYTNTDRSCAYGNIMEYYNEDV